MSGVVTRTKMVVRHGISTSLCKHDVCTSIINQLTPVQTHAVTFSGMPKKQFMQPKRKYPDGYVVPLPLYNIDQSKLKLPDCDPNCMSIDDYDQYLNPYVTHVNIPYLCTNDAMREKLNHRAKLADNPILLALQHKLKVSKETGEPVLLNNLPYTPRMNQQPQFIYQGDTDDVALPNPVQPLKTIDGKFTLTCLTTINTDVFEIEKTMTEFQSSFMRSTATKAGQRAADAAQRCLLMLAERVKNPALYEAFGLDDCHSSRQSMIILHTWMYLRAAAVRPSHITGDYYRVLMHAFDLYLQQDLKDKGLRTKRVELILSGLLPSTRATMTVFDKAIYSLVGGDIDPINGALYRTLYRFSEEFKFEDTVGFKNALLNKLPDYMPSHDVYMGDPVDMAYMNNLTQYICDNLYSCATATPRDYMTFILGLSDFVPIPKPPKQRVGIISKAEMERWSIPIYNEPPVPSGFAKLLGLKKEKSKVNLFLPSNPSGPAYRPPSFIYTAKQQKQK